MGPKVTGVLVVRISKLPFGNPGTKWHLGVGPMAKHKVYYKREGGGFPQVWAVVSLVSLWLLVVRLCTKVLQLRTNQLIVWFVQSMWVIELFVNLPTPIPKLQHALLPPKCYESKNTPQLLLLPLFTFGFVVESIKELGGVSNQVLHLVFIECKKILISNEPFINSSFAFM
jgi:hypothetical protein